MHLRSVGPVEADQSDLLLLVDSGMWKPQALERLKVAIALFHCADFYLHSSPLLSNCSLIMDYFGMGKLKLQVLQKNMNQELRVSAARPTFC